MALDERYFQAVPFPLYFADKDTGLPLAGGVLRFFADENGRIEPKPVYMLSGDAENYTYTSLGAEITLSSIGTIADEDGNQIVIYYYPYDSSGNVQLYYITCESSEGVPQWTEAAQPNLTDASDPVNDLDVTNQISNPQFTRIFINDVGTTTYTVAGDTDKQFSFAPDWDFYISGTGTVVVERIAIAGNENVITNPPYVLDITVSSGVTSCYLNQRFTNNSGLWSSNNDEDIYLSGHITAINEGASSVSLAMFYEESSGSSAVEILNEAVPAGSYVSIKGTTEDPIPPSSNSQSGESGYVDIYIAFPASSHTRISSIQVVPVASDVGGDIVHYDIQSSNREQALMGDYYIPSLEYKQIPSILTGWDFPLNPAQFGVSGTLSTSAYVWDQTIGMTSGGNFTYERDSVTGGLKFTSTAENSSLSIIQYLSGNEAKEILGTSLCSNIFGYRTSVSDNINARVYMFRGAAAATFPTLPTTIGTLSASGLFSLTASNWTEISRSGLGVTKAVLPHISSSSEINDINDIQFIGWKITDSDEINDTDKFAIVVTFECPDTGSIFTLNSISCDKGSIPTRPAPKTQDQVIQECQYYYEKSYSQGVYAGAADTNNSILEKQASLHMSTPSGTTIADIGSSCSSFKIFFKNIKRTSSSSVSFYDMAGSTSSVSMYFYVGGALSTSSSINISHWTIQNKGDSAVQYVGDGSIQETAEVTIVIPRTIDCWIQFHYTVDARLGVI